VAPALVLVLNLLLGVSLLAVALSRRLAHALSRGAPFVAAVPALAALALAVYVFGEDSYRGNGISRWQAYRSPGGALGGMFVLSLILMTVFALVLVYAVSHARQGVVRATAFAAGLTAVVLLTATIVGFSSN
jgi:hypothetical protein